MPFLGKEPAFDLASTSDLGDNVVTEAKLKDALVGDFSEVTVTASDSILLADATDSGNTKRDTVQGILDLAGGLTQSAVQATTSGTSVTFGSIPAGVKMIIVTFSTVSFSGSANIKVQIGTSSGIETSGYISSAMHTSTDVFVTDSFLMYSQGQGANAASGSMICTLQDADNFTWVESVSGGSDSSSHGSTSGGGTKSLSAELTQVKVSGGTFDLGKISIVYM